MLPFEEVKRKPEPLTESQVWGAAAAPTPVEPLCADPNCGHPRSTHVAYRKGETLSCSLTWLSDSPAGSRTKYACHCTEYVPAAPAESQGVERAQPVEGPRHTCGWQSGPVKKSDRDCNCGCASVEDFQAKRAAPVEGVERVTDDAPARGEPTCPYCGEPILDEEEDGGYTHMSLTAALKCPNKYLPAPPAKHTDDRPADTIPDSSYLAQRDEACRQVTELTDENLALETRIEVLEAALREAVKILSKKVPGMYVESRKIVIARLEEALAAPSGETGKV